MRPEFLRFGLIHSNPSAETPNTGIRVPATTRLASKSARRTSLCVRDSNPLSANFVTASSSAKGPSRRIPGRFKIHRTRKIGAPLVDRYTPLCVQRIRW